MAPPLTRGAAWHRAQNKAARNDHRCGKLWYAMRTLRRFTASELMAVADNPNRASVLAYCNKLRHAGYLRNFTRGQYEAIWTLIRDTGPLCPAILNNCTVVWDFNTDQEYPIRASR